MTAKRPLTPAQRKLIRREQSKRSTRVGIGGREKKAPLPEVTKGQAEMLGGQAMSRQVTAINEAESKVLSHLGEQDWDFACLPFAPIAKATGLDTKTVRRACRSLKRKGLTEFEAGLFTEDGAVAGSGYCITPAGRARLNGGQP
jgi:hypothetical protein